MALSLDSIYKPFNDFFMNKFATKEGEPVQFRFARLPQTFVDADFLNPANPDLGPSAELALQLFSEAVDGVATLDADGRHVSMGTSSFSDLYAFEILGPAIPFVPSSVTNDTERQAMFDSFTQVRSDALKRLQNSRASSLEPGEIGSQYHPSTPSPAKWWDKSSTGVWTPQSFQITDPAGASDQPGKPADQLLRMKIDDAKFNSMLATRVASAPAERKTLVMSAPSATLTKSATMSAARVAAPMARMNSPAGGTAVLTRKPMLEPDVPDVDVQPSYKRQIAMLPYKQRIAFQHEVADGAPTQTVVSTDINISFDFCAVNVERQWLHDAFINNRCWYIPGQAKGELSANNGHGAPAIPVGFVAIKKLRIKAPWSPADISNLANSVQFGPFNFSSNIVDGALCHDDVQIVAWLLKDLPDLPPNAAA